MDRSVSAVDAIPAAVGRMQLMLFRPFDPGKWLTLGFLTFLKLLGDGGGYSGSGWGRNSRAQEVERAMSDAAAWVSIHIALVAVLGFFVALILLMLIVLFLWLSARGTFCYLDCVATNRAEVVRPWKEHGRLADSYFFWRLAFSVVVLFVILLLAVPIVLSFVRLSRSGGEFGFGELLFGGFAGLAFLAVLAVACFAALVKVLLVDFVAPVQYVQRIRCSEAFRAVLLLAKANAGQFILYLVLRLLLAIIFIIAVVGFGCMTCCIAFCCLMIPVIGATIAQPYYLFIRAFPLYFLRGFGAGFDPFPPVAPAGPPMGGTGGWQPGAAPTPERAAPGAGPGASWDQGPPPFSTGMAAQAPDQARDGGSGAATESSPPRPPQERQPLPPWEPPASPTRPDPSEPEAAPGREGEGRDR